jgi:CRISPR-associated protein Csy2
MSNHLFVLIPNLQVQHANAVSAYWLIAPENVMAARQMAHALARKCGAEQDEAGVAIVHHDAQLLGEELDWRFRPHQRRGAQFINKNDYSSKNKHALSLQPTATMHLRVSLVIRLNDEADISTTDVDQFLHGGRLAGGQITEWGRVEILDTQEALCKRLTRGHLIVERTDLLESADEGIIDRFYEALSFPPEEPVATSVEGEDKTVRPWLSPATLGYAAITGIERRSGAREGLPSAYVEPLVGLIEYRPIRRALTEPLAFWDYRIPEEGVFTVTQNTH